MIRELTDQDASDDAREGATDEEAMRGDIPGRLRSPKPMARINVVMADWQRVQLQQLATAPSESIVIQNPYPLTTDHSVQARFDRGLWYQVLDYSDFLSLGT